MVDSAISDSPLRILLVLPSLDAGGAERVAVNLANGLLEAGGSPSILLTGAEGLLGERLDERIPLTSLARPRVRSAMSGVIRHIRTHRPEVVFTTHTHVNLALCAARPLLPRSTRLVVRIPMHAPRTLEGRSTVWSRRTQRFLYSTADLVIATSETMAADLRTFIRTHIEVVPNPVDTAAVRASVTTTPAAQRDGRSFVMVGRLRQQKAVDELIRAFAAASDASDRLDILGEGPERPSLERLIAELGLVDRVGLPGVRPDPWETVAAADAFLLASHNEGMPNAVLESLALGTPVIATTDLDMLAALSTEAGGTQAAHDPHVAAVTLVAREDLAAAIGDVRPIAPGTALPRPSLLPERFALPKVSDRTLHLMRTLIRAPRTSSGPR